MKVVISLVSMPEPDKVPSKPKLLARVKELAEDLEEGRNEEQALRCLRLLYRKLCAVKKPGAAHKKLLAKVVRLLHTHGSSSDLKAEHQYPMSSEDSDVES